MTLPAHDLRLSEVPVAKTGMLIRRPVAEVFEAFIDPAIASKFWFTGGSGRLETGKQVRWDWEMYDVSASVDVLEIERDRRIRIEWPSGDTTTTVEWVFTPHPDDTTFVGITNSGFRGGGDEIVEQALDAMGGFTLVLAGLKAFLEHDVSLNLVRDRHPTGYAETDMDGGR